MTRNLLLLLLFGWPGLLLGQGVSFSEISAAAGLAGWVQQDDGLLMGAGGAFFDYDGDGFDDILLAGGIGPLGLFKNNGDGTFTEVSAQAGLLSVSGTLPVQGAVCADVDNDGDADIYLLRHGSNLLLMNNGNGSFTSVSAGVEDPRWSQSAAFADYDGDGWLDLYVGNYIQALNFPTHTPWANALFHNNGGGSFTDVTAVSGVAGAGTTLATLWEDYDGDGDQDLFVGNDFGIWVEANRVYQNLGPAAGPPGSWAFGEVSGVLHADVPIYCMSLAAGDFDRDLDLDIYMSNLGANVLLQNNGHRGFQNVTAFTGTSNTHPPLQQSLLATSWAATFQDFDRDGWLDIFVSNGYIPAAPFLANAVMTPNALFWNRGPTRPFLDVAPQAGVAHPGVGRGAAFADFDRDGDIDILQMTINGPPLLFRNNASQGHYLELALQGRQSNRDAIGTRIQADLEGFALLRTENPFGGFVCSSSKVVHFGLGAAVEVPHLSLTWPSGIKNQLYHIPADQELSLVEPAITVSSPSPAPALASGGSTLGVQLVLENHRSQTTTALHLLVARILGQEIVLSSGQTSLPPHGTRTLTWSAQLPQPLTPGPALPLELIWSVGDPGGGLDQWRTKLTLLP